MPYFDDIVAPITGSPPAAVAIVRLSGASSWSIAASLFSGSVSERVAVYGRFSTGDDGLAIAFEEGRSFTGERSVEFNIHGSRASVEALLAACVACGARMARPGEFTERAFLNGRIDLTQAEGIRDTIEAVTDAQLRQANLIREGGLRKKIDLIRDGLIREMAAIDAHVDFSEEIGELDRGSMARRLALSCSDIEALLGTVDAGRFLREGVRIVIAGLPNSGKSSLLNAILGRDRAIVTSIAGTTRDYLEEEVELGGVRCVLIDTAGLRSSIDEVETEGVDRARKLIEHADAVWYLYDASVGWSSADDFEFGLISRPKLWVPNKIDLTSGANEYFGTSATTGIGMDRLAEWLQDFSQVSRASFEPLVNVRQAPNLTVALGSIKAAIETLENDLPEDLVAVQLREGVDALGRITGAAADEDMLERIFRDFCIGK